MNCLKIEQTVRGNCELNNNNSKREKDPKGIKLLNSNNPHEEKA